MPSTTPNSSCLKYFLTGLSIFILCYSCNDKGHVPHGFFPVEEGGKWGYINSDGQIVIDCRFDEAKQFSEGLGTIRIDSLYGFIDTTGKIVIAPQFYNSDIFSGGLCHVLVLKDSLFQSAFIRKDGTIAFVGYSTTISNFFNGRAEVTINEEVCYIDEQGKIVFNTHYPYTSGGFEEGIAHVWGGHGSWVTEESTQVWKGDSTRYFDANGNLIIALEGIGYEDFSEGLASVRIHDKACYIDRTGKVKIRPAKPLFSYSNFSGGLAKVSISAGGAISGFVDTTGNIVIPIIYRDVQNFSEGLAAYKENDLWGFINTKGKVVIKPQFQEVGYRGFGKLPECASPFEASLFLSLL